jgi:hypothetical protein
VKTSPRPAEIAGAPSGEERVLRRIKRNAFLLGLAGALTAFLFAGPAAALSLTIAAGIVILSFLGFERVTGRILQPRMKARASDFLFPAAGMIALILLVGLIFRWRGFDLIAGIAGFSVIVLAIGWEGIRKALGE